MKRIIAAVAVLGILAAAAAAQKAGNRMKAAPPSPACTAHAPACHGPSPDEEIVKSLSAVLEETQSTDTLVVIAKALQEIGPAARPAVPTIIKAAERLKVFDHHLPTDTAEDKQTGALCEALAEIITNLIKGEQANAPPAACVPVAPTPAASYPSGPIPPAPTVAPAAPPSPVPALQNGVPTFPQPTPSAQPISPRI
jgi:hypothetical protein